MDKVKKKRKMREHFFPLARRRSKAIRIDRLTSLKKKLKKKFGRELNLYFMDQLFSNKYADELES
jgi:hypothetical protein